MQFYFPASILLQYTDKASNVYELRELTEEDAIQLYIDFMKNTEEDQHTTICLLSSHKKQFLYLRKLFHGLMLGRDVVLFFSKEYPAIVDYDAEDLYYYIKELHDVTPKLKLRKMRRIERILATDMVFRLYYSIYDRLKDLLKKFKEVERKVANFTYVKSVRYTTTLSTYTPFHKAETELIHICFPESLRGIITSCFPLMSVSGVFQMGLMNFFASGRWQEISEEMKKLKGFGLNPSEEFLVDCKAQLELHLENYIGHLQRFIDAVETIGSEEDPITHFIVSHLPTTVLDLVIEADSLGYSPKIVASRIKSMLASGRLVMEGEVLKLKKQ